MMLMMTDLMADEFEALKEGMESWSDADILDEMFDWCEENRYDRKLKKQIRDVMVFFGVFRQVTEEELSRTQVLNGKKYCFIHRGDKYSFNKYMPKSATVKGKEITA